MSIDSDTPKQHAEAERANPRKRITPLEVVALVIASVGAIAALLQWRTYEWQWQVMREQLSDARVAAKESDKTTAAILEQWRLSPP
jgi:hypothetical protein